MTKNKEVLEFELNRKQMLNAHGNSHWRAKINQIANLRAMATERGQEILEERDVSFDQFKITVYIKPPTRRHIDPPNFYPTVKPIVDGLTDAGWWKDDSLHYMLEMNFRYGGLAGVKTQDGKNDNSAFRVILVIEEITDTSEYITKTEFID